MEESESFENIYFLDLEEGNIISIPDSVFIAFEEEETKHLAPWETDLLPIVEEIKNNRGRYEEIPHISSHESYNLMVKFAEAQTGPYLKGKLLIALDGKGAFRRFNAVLSSYPAKRKSWFKMKDDYLRKEALEWLSSIGIKIEEKPISSKEVKQKVMEKIGNTLQALEQAWQARPENDLETEKELLSAMIKTKELKKEIGQALLPLPELFMRKKNPKANDKIFVFEIEIIGGPWQNKNKCWREIAILGRDTLYSFGEAIVKSFNFYFDHCFGFYSNLKEQYHDSKIQYELFADLPDVEPTPAGSVKKTKISTVFENVGNKIMFLFDYGDGWRFLVELKEIKNPEMGKSYPVLLSSAGDPPEQYPPCEDY